MATLLDYIWI
jgi:hypothetical protein